MKPMKRINLILSFTLLALTFTQGLAQATYEPYTFTTLAGGGGFVSPDVPGTAARFFVENGVAPGKDTRRRSCSTLASWRASSVSMLPRRLDRWWSWILRPIW